MNSSKPSYLEEISNSSGGDALLCTHGLNQRPEALKPLLKDLEKMGFKAYLMYLPGHDGDENPQKWTAQYYFENYEKAYKFIYDKHQSLPYFIGYSFGGLIGVHHFDQFPFKKMVLLAPDLQLRSYTLLLRYALPFLKHVRSVSLGSREYEARYRYHVNGVPREIYQSFFGIYAELMAKDKSYLKESKALVLSHSADELVSYSKLQTWVETHTDWSMERLDNRNAEFKRYCHLCFDPVTLGAVSYASLLTRIRQFFLNKEEKPLQR